MSEDNQLNTMDDAEVEELYTTMTANFSVHYATIAERRGFTVRDEHDAMVYVIERRLNLTAGSFGSLVHESAEADDAVPSMMGGAGEQSSRGAPMSGRASGARVGASGGEGGTGQEGSSFEHAQIETLLTQEDLRRAMTACGFSNPDGEFTEEQKQQAEALFREIDSILGRKKPAAGGGRGRLSLIGGLNDEEHKHHAGLDWKALELIGDERLMDEVRERPAIDVHSHHASKAMQKMGTAKAVESKKIRDRLGSDMSTNQMHKMKVMELQERHKRETNQESGVTGFIHGLGINMHATTRGEGSNE